MYKKEENKSANREGMGCMVLFFAPFVIIGLGTFLVSTYSFFKTIQARNWVKTEAVIEHTNLNVSRANRADDVDTYKNSISYVYTIDGQKYRGDQVGFGYSQNNIDRHHQVARKLKYLHKIKVWVNPNNPVESVLTKGTNDSAIGLFLFSLMWNSLIGVFLIPLIIASRLDDEKNEVLNSQTKNKSTRRVSSGFKIKL